MEPNPQSKTTVLQTVPGDDFDKASKDDEQQKVQDLTKINLGNPGQQNQEVRLHSPSKNSNFPRVDLFLEKPPANLDVEDYLLDPTKYLRNRADHTSNATHKNQKQSSKKE